MSARFVRMALLIALSVSVRAQSEADKRLPVDDPDLYTSFCYFLDSFSTWLEQLAAAEPARRGQLMEAAGAYLKLPAGDIPKATAACRLLINDLKQLDTEKEETVRALGRTALIEDANRQFERRRATIRVGTQGLQQTLSPAGWEGLRRHINGEHRANVRRIGSGAQP